MTIPNFTKDQWQKIALSLIMFIILIYGYFQYLLGPLNREMEADTKSIAEFENKIEEARKQIKIGKNAIERSESATRVMKSIESMIPDEAVIAWFPPDLNKFFAPRGIVKIPVNLKNSDPIPGLDKFKYYNWDVNFPPISAIAAISALSDLENEKPLLEIHSIRIDSIPTDPEHQRVACEFKTLLK